MSNVAHAPARANRTTPAAARPSAAFAAGWHALLKVADKEAVRDDLAPGLAHIVDLTVDGTVDGEQFFEHIVATLSVGHDSQRASSATPSLDHVIGAILAKVNEVTRTAILRDLPEQFAANGCTLPDVPAAIAEQAKAMLARLRAKKIVDVHGPVSCRYTLSDVDATGSERKAAGCELVAIG